MEPTPIAPEAAAEIVSGVANLLFWHDSALYTGKDDLSFGDPAWMEVRLSVAADKREEALAWLPQEVVAAYRAFEAAEEAAELAELRAGRL